MPFLTIKIAFLYEDTRPVKINNYLPVAYPTYRISMPVYPEIKAPKVTAAMSKIDKVGHVVPYFVVGMRL